MLCFKSSCLSSQWLNRLENALVFEKYQWWGAVELARRLLLLVLVVPFPRNDVSALILVRICAYVALF